MSPTALGVLEWSAAIVTLVNVWLMVRASLWNYLPGLISAALYGWWYAETRYYGNAALSLVYYLPMQGYGYWVWKTKGPQHDDDLPLQVGGWRVLLASTALGLALAWPLQLVLARYNGTATWLDAITTSLSVVAQVLASWKRAENWPMWVIVDLIYIGMFLSQRDFVNVGMSVGLTTMALWGWRSWARGARLGAAHA